MKKFKTLSNKTKILSLNIKCQLNKVREKLNMSP